MVVLNEVSPQEVYINNKDLDWKFSRGSGPGGQHKNKTETCVNLTHIPTGIKVRVDSRSQDQNKDMALQILRAKLKDRQQEEFYNTRNQARKSQAGSGMRGDKIRTIRVRDDQVYDHKLNKKISYKQYSRGDLSALR